MFFIDKYGNDDKIINYYDELINTILENNNVNNKIYQIYKKTKDAKVFRLTHKGPLKYRNFPHIILYGNNACKKDIIINKLIKKLYSIDKLETKFNEYEFQNYNRVKMNMDIEQSPYHTIIKTQGNGNDKFVIREIIEEYSKKTLLNYGSNITKPFKIIVIKIIDNLSEYVQAFLRRLMEKSGERCKFIFICKQLSRVIEPIRSRCHLIRVPMPSNKIITNILTKIIIEEKIKINREVLDGIVEKSKGKINIAIMHLDFYNKGFIYKDNCGPILDKFTRLLINSKDYEHIIDEGRNVFYMLFIINIDIVTIFRETMKKLLIHLDDLETKFQVVELTSIFEKRSSIGTRYTFHYEAYIARILYLLNGLDEKKKICKADI